MYSMQSLQSESQASNNELYLMDYYNPFNIQFGLLDDEIAGTT